MAVSIPKVILGGKSICKFQGHACVEEYMSAALFQNMHI